MTRLCCYDCSSRSASGYCSLTGGCQNPKYKSIMSDNWYQDESGRWYEYTMPHTAYGSSSPRIGDRYVLEITDVYETAENGRLVQRCRAKGFDREFTSEEIRGLEKL